MTDRASNLPVPKLTSLAVKKGLARVLQGGPSLKARAKLRGLTQGGDGRIRLEAELALAFIDVAQRCSAHDTDELPRVVVQAIKGKENAMAHVKLTAQNATDVTARNLAQATLDYVALLRRWKALS